MGPTMPRAKESRNARSHRGLTSPRLYSTRSRYQPLGQIQGKLPDVHESFPQQPSYPTNPTPVQHFSSIAPMPPVSDHRITDEHIQSAQAHLEAATSLMALSTTDRVAINRPLEQTDLETAARLVALTPQNRMAIAFLLQSPVPSQATTPSLVADTGSGNPSPTELSPVSHGRERSRTASGTPDKQRESGRILSRPKRSKPNKQAATGGSTRSSRKYEPDVLYEGEKPSTYNAPHYRFVNNIGIWLQSLCNPKKSGNWDYKKLEELITAFDNGYLQRLVIPATAVAKRVKHSEPKGKPVGQSDLDEEAVRGLSSIEKEFCDLNNWKYAKYRTLRSAFLIGFACIYEQNARGITGQACAHHSSITGMGSPAAQFSSINAGKSQAQLVAPGSDATEASQVFGVLQDEFGWFPKAFLQTRIGAPLTLHDDVHERFPNIFRHKALLGYDAWQEAVIVDRNLRFIITDNDCACVCSAGKVKKIKNFNKTMIDGKK